MGGRRLRGRVVRRRCGGYSGVVRRSCHIIRRLWCGLRRRGRGEHVAPVGPHVAPEGERGRGGRRGRRRGWRGRGHRRLRRGQPTAVLGTVPAQCDTAVRHGATRCGTVRHNSGHSR
eukprot:24734-Prorocentrum_minimum.AAC.1